VDHFLQFNSLITLLLVILPAKRYLTLQNSVIFDEASGGRSMNVSIRNVLIFCGMLCLFTAFPRGSARAANPYNSAYLYITNLERAFLGGRITFSAGDITWSGPVHSNDTLQISNPIFYDSVSTSADTYIAVTPPPPQFYVPLRYNAPRIYFPTTATEIRQIAAQSGHFYSDFNHTLASLLVFQDSLWCLYQWHLQIPSSDTSLVDSGPLRTGDTLVIFVDGYLELKGVLRGVVTVGASGGNKTWIRLIDDVRYWFANPYNGSFNDSTGGYTDMLSIVSEGDIVIGNTWANGRYNSAQGQDIIINAALIALNESCTFEDQNDPFIWEFSSGTYVPPPWPQLDFRGYIFLWGSVAQYRRGYLLRNNHIQTGYYKRFHHDERFHECGPLGIPVRHMPILNPPELDFGEVLVGQVDTLEVILRNAGGTYLDIETISIENPVFRVLNYYTVSLTPGSSVSCQVVFAPLAPQYFEDTMLIKLCYGEDLRVPLRGLSNSVGIAINPTQPGADELALYPNPFNDRVAITFNSEQPPDQLTIYDLQGKEMDRKIFEAGSSAPFTYQWRPANCSGGIYFLAVKSRGRTDVHKLVYLK
jgi:hypothetical protein